MELREHPNKKYMAKYDRHEPLILDSYAMQLAKMCFRKYFFTIVIARSSSDTPVYFAYGSSYHKFREILETSKGDFKLALLAALDYWDRHQGADPPVGSKFDFMTKMRLMQSCKIAYDHWLKEKALGKIEVISVEQPFNIQLEGSDEYTSGRFDQIVRWNGKPWGRDFKTTSKEGVYYQRNLDPNDQFTRYTYAESKICGEKVHGQIIETLYNSKKAGPSITQYLSARSDYQLEDWKQDELMWRELLSKCREKDVWPKNEGHCIFCPFHSVCKMPSEGAQMAKLDAEFVERPWDNTTVGVDD